jgi:hypothetical protein
LIPVSRCNKSGLGSTQLGTNEAFTWELVWTDNLAGIANTSCIKKVEIVGTGSGGYIYVRPGNDTGNAVIAIRKTATSPILWSWHVWVPEDTPVVQGTHGIMDRLLGAVSKDPAKGIKTFGMHYLWGRKDPFPPSASATSDVEPTVYTPDGNKQVPRLPSPFTGIEVGVRNPFVFHCGGGSQDWLASHDNTLWGHNTVKSVYDPCPPGWRVPVAGNGPYLSPSPWEGIATFPVNAGGTGCVNPEYGGYYPFAGCRYGYNGTGQVGYTNGSVDCWTASRSSTDLRAYLLSYIQFWTVSKPDNPRGQALSVRCVVVVE